MSKKEKQKRKPFDYGHLKSQKFAGLVISIIACFCAGLFLISEPTTSAVVMGIVALYASFVGGRTLSDNAALKFGGKVNTTDNDVSVVKKLPKKGEKEEKDEID